MNDILFIAGAAAYAVVFWLLGMSRPRLALALIFALSPFQQDISGGGPLKFSIAEVNLLLSVPMALLRTRRVRFGPTFWPALAFILVGLGCSLLHWHDTSLICVVQSVIYLVLAVFVFASLPRSVADLRLAFDGFIFVGSFLALCICASGSGYVLGLQKNGAGSSIAAALLIAIEMSFRVPKRRIIYQAAIALLTVALVLTLSRGSWLSAVTGTLVILLLRRKVGQMVQVGLIVGAIAGAAWFLLPAESKDYAMGFDSERWNIKLRYESQEFASAQFHSSPIYGMGMGLRKEYDATNLFMLTLAETGIIGVIAFLSLHAVLAAMIWGAQRRVGRRELEFSILAVAAALIAGKLVHGMVDHYWSRGTLMAAWGAVGMAVFVAHTVRRRKKNPINGVLVREHLPAVPASSTVECVVPHA
jgi:hypothetical protein